jgi:hypothetical protein
MYIVRLLQAIDAGCLHANEEAHFLVFLLEKISCYFHIDRLSEVSPKLLRVLAFDAHNSASPHQS